MTGIEFAPGYLVDLAHHMGQEAGTRSMRRAGRKRWNAIDRETALRERQRILRALGYEEGNPAPPTTVQEELGAMPPAPERASA